MPTEVFLRLAETVTFLDGIIAVTSIFNKAEKCI